MARARARGRLLLLLLAFLAVAAAARHDAPAPRASSSISAAPEYPRLPNRHHGRHAAGPALPPALPELSPDIMPVLPSPAEDGAAPAPGAEEPTIPSSPSPPNPDALEPDSALAPFGSAHAVAQQSPAVASASTSALPVLGGLLAMLWLLV